MGDVLGECCCSSRTTLCTGAINGVTSHSRLYVMTTNVMMFIAGRLLLGIGGVVAGAIGPVNTS